mgnify:CR=1 FL=1
MQKKYFFLKLVPSRPDFAQTMSEEERKIMSEHSQYWTELMNKGLALLFGPVLDPGGTFGIGILIVDKEDQAHELAAQDPASKLNRYEINPLLAKVAGH